MGVKESLIGLILKKTLVYAQKDPERNLDKILNFLKALAPIKKYKEQIESTKQNVHKEPYWSLITRVLKSVDTKLLTTLGYNFFVNTLIIGQAKNIEMEKKYGFMGPFTILISPTMRCNLRCVGCYAGEYTRKDDLSLIHI